MKFHVEAIRDQFPALSRIVQGLPAVFFDGPAGSQVPRRVIDAMSHYLAHSNANTGGSFITSNETDELISAAQTAAAEFVGSDDPDAIVFGPNMTTLTFALSRSLARTWSAEDEVVVTRLDHDANVTPWVLAARDAGATVRRVPFHREDTTLDIDALRAALSPKTRLVAVGAASNATGTINPIREICALAHEVGAEVFVDAVHYAPHALIDVAAWDCDYVACSPYKFFGPHHGILWGKRARMSALPAYQVRPAGDDLPDRWLVGTQSHESIAGTLAAIDYLADLGRGVNPDAVNRRHALVAAYEAIATHEAALAEQFLRGLEDSPEFTVWGIRDRSRLSERVPTIAITHADHPPAVIAERLGAQGIFVWSGNYYAIGVTEYLGLEPEGMVRIGFLHYNTAHEVDRLLDALRSL